MIIKEATYVVSGTSLRQCPESHLPEYAFIGRSNVGKSSLINMLARRKNLARISKTPGKTRMINFFIINNEWYLVDLPGYGYARAPRERKNEWDKMVRNYILKRKNLHCLFVLIDARHPPQKRDTGFMELLGMAQIPFAMIFTKTDKLTENELQRNISAYKRKMLGSWEKLPVLFETSAQTGKGRDKILDYIEQLNLLFNS